MSDGGDDRLSGVRSRELGRVVLLAAVLAALGVAAVRAGVDVDTIGAVVADAGWLAPVAYIGVYAALTVAMVPGTILTLSGGLLFGVALGSALTVVGATLGAVAAYLVARATGRSLVDRLASGWVERVDAWLGARGLTAVVTLRLIPLVPFNAANYAAGVTAIRLRDYVLGTVVGIVPGVVAYTALGAGVADPTGPGFIAAAVGLALLAVVGSYTLRRRGRSV